MLNNKKTYQIRIVLNKRNALVFTPAAAKVVAEEIEREGLGVVNLHEEKRGTILAIGQVFVSYWQKG